MFDYATNCGRMAAVYRGDPVDRVPICSPIAWSPASDIDADRPEGWAGEDNFVRVARMVQEHCDARPPFSRVGCPKVWAPQGYQRFGEAPDEFIEKLPDEDLGGGRTRHTTVLHTPKGDLKHVCEDDAGIRTSWDIHKPIQCAADVEKMLSVPYRFDPPDTEDYQPFREHRAEMGRDAIGGAGVNSMVAMLCGMMSFQLLLEWALTEPGLVKTLADVWLERSGEKVDFMLSQGVGPFWSFNGVERASPPMMGPKQWDDWVMPYDGEIMRRIKAADPEARIHVHCHGRVGTLLERFIEMGVDSTDPVEPPSQGDIEFADAKALAAGRLTLFGNIEFVDMETLTPDEVEAKVRSAIEDGGKDHTVLYPSSTPHERHTDRFTANAIRYIEAGLKYGER